ncbi:MAG TPA: transposase [Steroidobacteraceae bacterium]|nr:transposase [Steroidobacteraceae bacterium]
MPGGVYHITLRGNHQQPIFFEHRDRSLLNKIVARAVGKYGARLHAYCWMTNHLHLVLQAGVESVSRPMHDIAAEYARAMQIRLQTTGHFFERRFHATLVDTDSYMMELLRYVHRNPVTAGLVSRPDSYPWSSHHEYMGTRSCDWLTTDFALALFGSNRASAIRTYRAFVDAEVEEPWEPARVMAPGMAVLGGDDFIARMLGARPAARSRQSLNSLVQEACGRFEITEEMLSSPVRNAFAAKVRGWIAFHAARRGIASLAAVARRLGRTEGSLRYAIRAHPEEME